MDGSYNSNSRVCLWRTKWFGVELIRQQPMLSGKRAINLSSWSKPPICRLREPWCSWGRGGGVESAATRSSATSKKEAARLTRDRALNALGTETLGRKLCIVSVVDDDL